MDGGGILTKIISNNKQVRIDKEALKRKTNEGVLCNNGHRIDCHNVEVWSWLRNLQTNQ